jgi:hypothetical protein
MLCMSVCMHSRFVENHLIRILKNGALISEVVLSQKLTVARNGPAVLELKDGARRGGCVLLKMGRG